MNLHRFSQDSLVVKWNDASTLLQNQQRFPRLSIMDVAELKISVGPPSLLALENEKYKTWKNHAAQSLESAKKAQSISFDAFNVSKTNNG